MSGDAKNYESSDKIPSWLPGFFVVGVLLIGGAWYQSPIWSAEAAVRERMIDPAAAEFRNVRRGEQGAICGEVNGKNGFGAYKGFVPFFVDASGIAMIHPGDSAAVFNEKLRVLCR